ncbi:winged helix-turn-helix transcriptional regulator [Mucilaginibacter pineti]|uniref:winged helix-turn-helix transcriptional regulator n=1 Tax=Mucilaginibacter pineti TaxID=1391627 RepID=UPI001967A776
MGFSHFARRLEEDGLIICREYQQKPPRAEYELSTREKTLIPVLKAMFDWGVQVDDQCGTSLTISGVPRGRTQQLCLGWIGTTIFSRALKQPY